MNKRSLLVIVVLVSAATSLHATRNVSLKEKLAMQIEKIEIVKKDIRKGTPITANSGCRVRSCDNGQCAAKRSTPYIGNAVSPCDRYK